MSKLIWRWPDRLLHIFSLSMVREGEWLCQVKWDGHFAVIIKDGDLKVMSRHNKPLPVSTTMLESLRSLSLDDGDVLHGEWTSRREMNKAESMVLFSQTHSKYEWLGNLGEEERFASLTSKLQKLTIPPNISLVESQTCDYAKMYKRTIDDLRVEGVVLKRRDAKLKGALDKSVDNPAFLKLKTRGGADGCTKMVIPDENLVTLK